jgi:hypothetical protein
VIFAKARPAQMIFITTSNYGIPHPLYVQDSLSLLGDVVGSCVRPSAPDGDVWKAMADKKGHF